MKTKEVKNEPLGTSLAIRARLMALGWVSVAVWGAAFGHRSNTVFAVIRVWGTRSDRAPHGGLSRLVVRDLRATLTQGLGPADVKLAA
jgi:hypothetical protein